MLDLTKWHNWVALTLMLLLVGFALHQVGQRVPAVGNVTRAAFGS